MIVFINTRPVEIPSTLSDFTLGRRLDWQEQYGDELDKMLDSIAKMDDGVEKELELLDFYFERMYRSFAFFTDTKIAIVRASDVEKIALVYNAAIAHILEDPKEQELSNEFIFNNERWLISEPLLKHGDKMSFGEIIDAKQMIRDTFALGIGRWPAVYKLAAIFLRRPGEVYEESFLYDNSERLQLMRSLPMSIAYQVAFFLSALTSSSQSLSIFFASRELKVPESLRGSISSYTVGLIFSRRLRLQRFLISRGPGLIRSTAPEPLALSTS